MEKSDAKGREKKVQVGKKSEGCCQEERQEDGSYQETLLIGKNDA
tara:strand:+ start:733 stop:867 length:135 start_codon:yes stop_codon:yes gene_type:complete